jgi:hypothetical protein
MWLYRLFRRFKKEPEIYVNQPVIERYGDREEIGQWGCVEQLPDGSWRQIEDNDHWRPVRGTLYSETVKYKADDGSVRLGKEWVI